MTTKRATETTGDRARGLASPPRATTYEEAQDRYRSTTGAQDRFEELTTRDLTARAETAAGTRAGTWAPQPGHSPGSAPGTALPAGSRQARDPGRSLRAGMEAHP